MGCVESITPEQIKMLAQALPGAPRAVRVAIANGMYIGVASEFDFEEPAEPLHWAWRGALVYEHQAAEILADAISQGTMPLADYVVRW